MTDNPLSVTNIAELTTKLASLNDYSLGEVPVSPTDQFKYSLYSFYVTDIPLSITNVAEQASLNDYPPGDIPVSPTCQFK